MILKAKRDTKIKHFDSRYIGRTDYPDKRINNGEGIELNLDDFEVVDGCDCVKYCHSSTRLRKTWYTCKHGTREMKLANPKPDTPKPIEMQEDVRGLTLPTIRWMEQVTDTVNKLTSTTDSQCKCDTRTAI